MDRDLRLEVLSRRNHTWVTCRKCIVSSSTVRRWITRVGHRDLYPEVATTVDAYSLSICKLPVAPVCTTGTWSHQRYSNIYCLPWRSCRYNNRSRSSHLSPVNKVKCIPTPCAVTAILYSPRLIK